MAYGTLNVDSVSTSSGQILGAGNATGFKNRIINGAMTIDQRNNGSQFTTGTGTTIYTLDRWNAIYAQTSKYTVQQNAGSVTPPVGFTNYLGVTSSSAYSVGSSDYFSVREIIEGYNVADLAWGTANAKPVTLSFWVYSSLTGTFGGAFVNGSENRSYPFSYSVPSANTWTYITVSIAGDTTGTWATNNSAGLQIRFGLGAGSTFLGTAGAWAAGNYIQPTGTVSVVGTNGATFYITGVQLEVGSVATSFDVRDYGRELILCQRYYIRYKNQSPAGYVLVSTGRTINTTYGDTFFSTPVSMRTAPTLNYSALSDFQSAYGTATAISFEQTAAPFTTMGIYVSPSSGSGSNQVQILQFQNVNTTTAFIDFSAEL